MPAFLRKKSKEDGEAQDCRFATRQPILAILKIDAQDLHRRAVENTGEQARGW